MDYGEEDCPRCGTAFDVAETRANFDRYYSGSAEWKWDDLPERMCSECADTDVEDRWMAGTLDAADGPPPSEEAMKDVWKKIRTMFPG